MDELDEFLLEHAEMLTKPAKRSVRQARTYRCSCGMESTHIVDVKGHAWRGHTFQMFGQKPWSES